MVALMPFKAYAITVFLIAAVWSREIRGEPMIVFMVMGYGASVLFLLAGAIAQRLSGKRDAAMSTFVWSVAVLVLGAVFALRWLPTLAE
jgi:hypothetical protein